MPRYNISFDALLVERVQAVADLEHEGNLSRTVRDLCREALRARQRAAAAGEAAYPAAGSAQGVEARERDCGGSL